MPIVGTAGHVDHGKSTLVEALTGRDPDRWLEEKERGLTIDLGFAWAELGGRAVGFVDVPGHERFIKNMLAGVGAVDVALFVVAADEGWMPQSEEHLSVLDLLGVRHGVIAVTRADTVAADLVELAELEIHDRVAGTSLDGWPIVATAAPTGGGIDELRDELAAALDRAGPAPDRGRPRLWVDRAFTIAGAGTVVTGTLLDGSIDRGDELSLWPPGSPVRIRGVQSHETEVDRVAPGSRAALNLVGTERTAIARGAMIGRRGDFRTTRAFLVDLRAVRSLDEPLTDRGAYHLHVGSGSWPVRLRRIEDAEAGFAALLRSEHPLPLTVGDRLILREVGRRAVVAGGRVLDPHPAVSAKRSLAARLPELRRVCDGPPDDRAEVLLEDRGITSFADLARDSGGGRPAVAVATDRFAVSESAAAAHAEALEHAVRAYQLANPLRRGAPKASLGSELDIDISVAEAVIRHSATLVDDGATVRTSDFAPQWGPDQEAAWQAAQRQLRDAGLAVPRAAQLGLTDEVLHALLRDGRLVRIAPDLVYLPEQLRDLQARLEDLEDGFTVADFRDAMGMTRRQAVPVLEWLDAEGWTSRRGDARTVRRRPLPGPGDVPPR